MHDYQRDSHATSQTAIYANITQTGRIRVYCKWVWVVLAGFGWFRVLVTTHLLVAFGTSIIALGMLDRYAANIWGFPFIQ